MKNGKFLGLLCLVFVLVTFAFGPKAETFTIVPTDSTVNWTGYKVTGKHTGTIAIKAGALVFKDDLLEGGEFEMDMSSITCTDLEGEYAGKLVGHLSSEDFFGVEKYPTASFKITRAIPYGEEGKYKIIGDMNIKDKKKEIKFLADVNVVNTNVTASAKVEIDRTDFDVRYGSGSFFDNLGDKTIYDEFELVLDFKGTKMK